MTYGSSSASIVEVTTPPVARVTGPSLWLQDVNQARFDASASTHGKNGFTNADVSEFRAAVKGGSADGQRLTFKPSVIRREHAGDVRRLVPGQLPAQQ
jgi:hypothetical protein